MKIILDITHDYGRTFKLDFDKFLLDGLSTIRTLQRSKMPAGHHSDSDSTLLPLLKSTLTCFGGIFAR